MPNSQHHDPLCQFCPRREQSVFKGMSPESVALCERGKSTVQVPKGQVLFESGQRIKWLYCVQQGIVKLHKAGDEGKDQILRLVGPGEAFGYRAVLGQRATELEASALVASTVCMVPAAWVLEQASKNIQFTGNLLEYSIRGLDQADRLILDLSQKTVRERLCQTLLWLEERFGRDQDGFLAIRLSRAEFASLVGTASEGVIRFLSQMKQQGWISTQGKRLRIENPEQLALCSKARKP